jgi:hypothetical protein
MATVNKDFVVKNGLQVGGLATLAAPASAGSLAFPSSGSDASSPGAGHLWRNATALKFYNGSATKTLAFTDSTMTGTWNGGVISPTYGGTGVNNGTSTITLGGNLAVSGAYATTFTVTATTALTLPTSGTVTVNTDKLSVFAATSSSELAGVISDETGSGALVFATSPTFSTSINSGATFAAFASATSLTIGGSSSSQTVNIGSASTGTSTYNLATGVTGNGNTKTVNIGTSSDTGSTTNVNIGSAAGGTVTINKDLTVSGDLVVNGSTTTVNSTTITVDDKNIELGSTASPTDAGADGGGITLKGATDKTLNWVDATDSWTSSENIDLASGKTFKINNSNVLSSTRLSLAGGKVESPGTSVSVTSGVAASVASFPVADFRSGKFIVQITQGSDYMVSEILVVHDGTNGYTTEYGRIQTGSTIDATFTADVASGTLHLYVESTSASAGSPLAVRHTVQAIVV